jgi:uncharacterized membrane protein
MSDNKQSLGCSTSKLKRSAKYDIDQSIDLLKDKELIIKRKYLTLKYNIEKIFRKTPNIHESIKEEFKDIVSKFVNEETKIELLDEFIEKYSHLMNF